MPPSERSAFVQSLLERRMPMQTDQGPGQIVKVLGEIDDQLVKNQNDHAELTGKVKRRKVWVETYIGALFDTASGDTVTERKENAKGLLHDDPDYNEYLADTEKLAELDKQFEYLETRKGIGQSILKALQAEGSPYGQSGRGQAGTPEPS